MRLLLLSVFIQVCLSYKFLVYSPLFAQSHTTFMATIADTLTAAGHNVTFFVPIFDDAMIGKRNVSLTMDIIILEADPRVREFMGEVHKVINKLMWEMTPDIASLSQVAVNMTKAAGYSCEHVFKQKELLEELRRNSYDVGIAEAFSVCGLGVFEYLNLPATIGALSMSQVDLVSWNIGEPIAPSYVPSMGSNLGDKMTFFQRLKNAFETAIGFKMMGSNMDAEAEHIFGNIDKKGGHYGDLMSKCSFMFANSNPYLNYPRPLLHKTIEIGGITIDVTKPDPLETKWDNILNARKHTVFISFGSVAKSMDMPEHWKKSILEMCASLPDVTFIWKYEVSTTMAEHLPNVHLSPWLPQNTLLADKRLSLFITHGGLGSITEVAHLGKPTIVIPLFADQPRNAEMLVRHGGAIALHKTDLGDHSVLKNTILKILNDNRYAQAATRLRNMLNEQPFSPKELVIRHAEFVAKMTDDPTFKMYEAQAELVETKQELERIRGERDELQNQMAANHLMKTVDDFQRNNSDRFEAIEGNLRRLTTTVSNNDDTFAEIKEMLKDLKETIQVQKEDEKSLADDHSKLSGTVRAIQVNFTTLSTKVSSSEKTLSEINKTLRKQNETLITRAEAFNKLNEMKETLKQQNEIIEVKKLLLVGGRNKRKKMDSLLILQNNGGDVGNWKQLNIKLPYAVESHGAQFLNNNLYIFGGYNEKDEVLNSTYKLSISYKWYMLSNSFQWEKVADMNKKRINISSSNVILNYQIWVIGGRNGEERLKSVEIYDSQMNIWTNTKEMNECRSLAAAAVANGKIFCCGGHNGNNFLKSAEFYDPFSDVWTLISDMPGPNLGCGIVVIDAHLLVIGGRANKESDLNSVWVLDTADKNGKWIEKQPRLSLPRSQFSIAKIDDKIFVCGGVYKDMKDSKVKSANCVEIFDEDVWKNGRKLPITLQDSVAVVIPIEFARYLS